MQEIMSRIKLPKIGAVLVLLSGFAWAPLGAGTVYVGPALNGSIGALTYETELVVSNPTSTARSFTVYEIAAGVDGTPRPDGGLVLDEITVAPGTTMILTGLTSTADGAMLEVTADSQLVISARLNSSIPSGDVLGVRVPVVGSTNAIAGGTTHHLQAFERSAEARTAFGMFNLSHSPNTCAIDIATATGAPLIPRTLLTLEPLSHSYFQDVLGLIGVDSASDVRLRISCDRASYSYGIVRRSSVGDLKLVAPSQTGASLFNAPGTEEPCPDGGVCFDIPAFSPSPGNDIFETDLPLDPSAIYSSIRVEMDFFHGGWHPISDGLHGLFWIYRNQTWRGNTFGYNNLRGPGRNLASQLANVNLPAGETRRKTQPALFLPGETYRLVYEYNAASRVMSTRITDSAGNVVVDMADTTPNNRVPVQDGFAFQMGLHREAVEVPTYGWVYSNVRIIFR